MIDPCCSTASKPFWKSALAFACLVGSLTTAGAASAASTAASSAYGEQVTVSAVPLLGGGITITSGPVPQASGSAPGPYTQNNTLASASAGSSLTGNLLSTGVINVSAASPVPATNQANASAVVTNPAIDVVGNLQLLTLAAGQITSSAQIGGTCGSALTATGASVLTGAHLGGVLASGSITATPAPNTELLNIAGIRIVLNEQTRAGDGATSESLTVNAVHVSIANALLTGLGLLSGDIVIAHSQASLDCNGLPNAANLSVTKSSSPNPATVGQNLTYTITVANAGPDTATNVTVSDPLPAGAAFVSAAASQGACSGTATVSCSLGSIPAGGSATITIVTLPTQAGTLINSATAGSTTTDPGPGNNTGSTSTTVNPSGGGNQADLSVSASAAPSPATVGSQLNYSIQVANAGPNGAGGVIVTDTLPAGVTFVSASPSQGTCTGTAIVVCDLGTLASGATASVAIAVVPTAAGILIDAASAESSVPDPNPANNSVTLSTTVNPGGGGGNTQADLSMTKSAAPNPVTVGSPLTYTLTVHNAGPSAAANVATTDTLPATVTFVSAASSQGSCSGTSTVGCNLGTLASGASATVTIVVLPTQSGALVNNATVSSSNPDPGPGNNTGGTTTTVNPPGGGGSGGADLSLSGTAAPNPVTVGNQLSYTILVKNAGPSGAGNVIATDTLPAGVTFVSSLASQGACTGTTTITCNLGTIAAGGTVGIAIQVVPTMAGILVDQVSVASSTADPNSANNRLQLTTTVTATGTPADLSITKSAAPSPVTVGSPLTYTLTVHNAGPGAANNVLASDVLPAGVTLVSATTTQGSCSGSFSIACNLGTVAASATIRITIVVTPTAAGTLINHANVSSSNPDPASGNNNATTTTTVTPATGGGTVTPADLSITKTVAPAAITLGATLTYTVTVTNNGPASATGVVATDALPASATLVSTTPSQGTCAGTTTVSCNLGTLASGASASIAIVVLPTEIGTLVNSASVSSNDTDADPGNNTSTVSAAVTVGGLTQCRIDDAPAATLLIPYFAVDLSSSTGMDTFFTVVNSAAAPQLASVTLWSDWAIPVMTFDLYLTGYGTQTVDLRSILNTGKAPATGPGVDSAGGLSSANQSFPGCNANNVAGAPARAGFLQRALSGRRILSNGLCYATEKDTSIATGYVTIDAANSCSGLNPSSPGYFAGGGTGIASNDNVLLGDYYYSNPGANVAGGEAAVHIAADAGAFGANQYTFYARYVGGNGADNRQPLGGVYGVHYLTTGEFNTTQLTVWRDTKSADVSPVACGSQPAWAPLSTAQSVVWDEQEKNTAIGPGTDILPLATQVVSIGGAALPLVPQAGWMALDLSQPATSLFGTQAQGWVTVLHGSTSASASWSERAWHLDNACAAH